MKNIKYILLVVLVFISCVEEGEGLFNNIITDSYCNDSEIECLDGSCVNNEDDCPELLNQATIYYTNNSFYPIADFQFTVTGVDLVDASGGDAAQAGFVISSSDVGIVIGFSSWSVMNQGGGILLDLDFFGNSSELCLTNLVFSSSIGHSLNAYLDDCSHIIIENSQ